jgi:hypothetical protein
MGRAERVVDVDIGVLAERSGELDVVGLFPRCEPKVLQHDDVVVRQLLRGDDVEVGHGPIQQRLQRPTHRREAQLVVDLALGTAEMRSENQLRASPE